MVDWKGLLNWSLTYQDGTKPSNFKQMSEEDRKFLEDAFESVCINEMKEIWKILDILKTKEGDTEKEINERCELLENLSGFLDGPENARNVIRGKRFNEIIQCFFESTHKKVTISLARILTQMMQNDGYIQKAAMSHGIFNFLSLLNETSDNELTNIYIYMLTGILYGDEAEVREHFVKQLNGMTLIYNLLIKQRGNSKSFKRLLNIVGDLTKMTDKLAKKETIKLREDTLLIISNIHLNDKLIEILREFDYENKENVDVIHVLFDVIGNLVELYNADYIIEIIKGFNKKICDSHVLNEDDKKEEKKFLIEIIKKVKNAKNENGKQEGEENVEKKLLGCKESMHIEVNKK